MSKVIIVSIKMECYLYQSYIIQPLRGIPHSFHYFNTTNNNLYIYNILLLMYSKCCISVDTYISPWLSSGYNFPTINSLVGDFRSKSLTINER